MKKGLIPYHQHDIQMGDILRTENLVFGRVYSMGYSNIGTEANPYDSFYVCCRGTYGRIFPGLYIDDDLKNILFIDRRTPRQRFISLFTR